MLLGTLAFLLVPGAARAQTVVSLTFDDGIATQMLIRSSLQSHGMRGTFHVNSGNVGANSYYMTWANVDALNADGNEIAGHTVDHQRLTDLTANQQRSEICDDATALRARGYTVNTFAYPYGAGSSNTNVRQALVDCGYLTGRKFGDLRSEGCTDTSCPYAESIPPPDPYGVRTPEWQADEYNLTELQTFVTQAETHGGGWVPLVFHDMCNNCADSSVSVSTFNSLLDWLQARAASGTVVKTTREVVAPTAASADVSVTKTDSPDPVTVGGNVTYTIKVHNQGPNAATAVTMTDALPTGLTLVSAGSTKGTCSGTTTVSCNIGTVNSGTANDVTVTVVATAGVAAAPSVTNTASVSNSTPDPNTANNQASATTTVNPSADVSVTKTDSPDPVSVGSNVTYTITAHNNGPSPAAGVSVSDTLPTGLTLVSASSTKGTCSGTTTVSCAIGTLNSGAANDATVTIVASVGTSAAASTTNNASISSTTADPSSANNQASATTTVNPSADVSVTKTDSPDPVTVGDDVTYTITVHNAGPSPASAVSVSDPLPTGLTLVSASPSKGTCSGTTTVTCAIGTLNAGAANDATVTIVATAGQSAAPSVTNTASVSTSTADPSASNDQASATTTVTRPPSADLQLSKTDSPDPVQVGESLTYTLTVHNAGPDSASGVDVSDPLPSEVTLVSATPSQGSCTGTATVACDLGAVAAGASNDATVTIVVTPNAAAVPSITNTATVTATTTDPDSANNEASAGTTVEEPPPPSDTYVRPRGAGPFRASLVPAFAACDSPDSLHGPPLVAGSCRPPQQISDLLTIGSPDANGEGASFTGSAVMHVVTGDSGTSADEANVELDVSLADLRNANDLSDYTGELAARFGIRLTDRLSGAVQNEAATVDDFDLELPVPCAATASTEKGATCVVATTADAVIPGMVTEGRRSIWELAKVAIDDGGPDATASTPDNATFAVQGVFVP